jgi:DNA-binding IscR family transcriptional regulator
MGSKDDVMKISTKGRYDLRLMLDLAITYGGENIPIKEISKRQDISTNIWNR